MKTNLQKLKAILCENEEIKKQVMELKFGCEVEGDDFIGKCLFKTIGGCLAFQESQDSEDVITNSSYLNKKHFKIIGNPIQEHHLRIYCLKNHIIVRFSSHGSLTFEDRRPDNYDDTKPLHKQSEEVLGEIVEFLETNK